LRDAVRAATGSCARGGAAALRPWLRLRLPQTGERGLAVKRTLQARLVAHKQYIDTNGQDLPEIRDWTWSH